MTAIAYCRSCGRNSLGCKCGMSFREKVGAGHLSVSVRRERGATMRGDFDRAAIDDQFGGTAAERRDRLMEETDGIGYVRTRTADRAPLYKNRKTGEVEVLPDSKLDEVFLGGKLRTTDGSVIRQT